MIESVREHIHAAVAEQDNAAVALKKQLEKSLKSLAVKESNLVDLAARTERSLVKSSVSALTRSA